MSADTGKFACCPHCAEDPDYHADGAKDDHIVACLVCERSQAAVERLRAGLEFSRDGEVARLTALLKERDETIERGSHEAWAAGVEAAFESLGGYLEEDFEAVLATNPHVLGPQRSEARPPRGPGRQPLKATIFVEDPNAGESGETYLWEVHRFESFEFGESREDEEIYSDFAPALLMAKYEVVSLDFRFFRPLTDEKTGEHSRLTVRKMQ